MTYSEAVVELSTGDLLPGLIQTLFTRRDVGGRGTPRSFVEQRQASLDRRYGEGKYLAPTLHYTIYINLSMLVRFWRMGVCTSQQV